MTSRARARSLAHMPPSSATYSGMAPSQILSIYPAQYRHCRTRGHRWPEDPKKIRWVYVGRGLLDRIYACERCGAIKTEHLNNAFRRVDKSGIYYPTGYLTPRTGLERADFTEVTYSEEYAVADAAGHVSQHYPYEEVHREGETDGPAT